MLALLSTGLLLALPFQQAQRSDALAPRPLFVDPHEFLLPSDLAPANFALGDVDVDGDVDVLALETFGPFESYRPKVWRNEGGGRLRRGPEIEFPFLFPAHVELVDLDGDLDLDALVGEYLLVNTGSLRFALDPVPQPFALQTERTFADFDGDGAKDALFAATGTAVLLLNDGLGHFSDAFANLPFGLPATDFVASGDVDGDLDADLLAGAFGATYLLLNDGTGVFTDASGNLPATTTFGGFELADVDGDLDLDALAFGELWTNDGSGVFIDASAQLPGTSGAGGTLLDLEGDGDPDLLAGDRVLVNDGSGVFALAPALVPALPGFRGIGDLDGDGDADLVGGTIVGWDGFHAVPGTCTTLLGDGAGGFQSLGEVREEIAAPRLSSNRPLLADMDGDGMLDVVVGSDINTSPFGTYAVQTFLRRGDGHGRFGAPTPDMDMIQGHLTALAATDLEGDGDLDLLTGSRQDSDGSGAGIKRLVQQPGLVFVHPEGPGSHLSFGNVSDFEVGDLDGDGDADLAFGTVGPVPMTQGVAHNDGSGTFAALVAPSFLQQNKAVELVDVDADGDLDACWLGDSAVLQRNDGASWTNVSGQLSFTSGDSLDAGDVDQDGDADLLVGDGTRLRLHRNGGSGSFTAARILTTRTPIPGAPGIHGRFADLEGDGDLDVLSSDADPYLNAGAGRLAQGLWSGRVDDAQALGDLDQDGDLDLFVPRGGDSAVRANQMRHVQWRNLPQLGRDLVLELSGPRAQAYVLYSSPNTGSALIPGQGYLLLGAPLLTVAIGTLDGRGRAVVPVPVPNNLALIGTTLHWQGKVGNAPRFTNRDRTTITGY